MDKTRRLLTATILSICLPPALAGQEHDHAVMDASASLRAGGEAVFEALAEAVARLEADAGTDWSRVDLDALRAHLLDMNALFQRAVVETEPIAGGARYRVTGGDDALAAARRMVPAHARAVGSERGWNGAVRLERDAVVLEVTASDEAGAQRIRGLGFFGLMAAGDHHRPHHLAIARGESPHGGHDGDHDGAHDGAP